MYCIDDKTLITVYIPDRYNSGIVRHFLIRQQIEHYCIRYYRHVTIDIVDTEHVYIAIIL